MAFAGGALAGGDDPAAHLAAAERARARRAGVQAEPAEAGEPEPPAGLGHVWLWFLELHTARGGSGFGPAALGWGEIESWCRVTGTAPTPAELELIRLVDQQWLAGQAEKLKVRTPGRRPPQGR